MKHVIACVFHPPPGTSEAEKLVDAGRLAATRDLIATLREASLEPIVVASPAPDEASPLDDLNTEISDLGGSGPFHFGETLKGLVRRRRPDGLLYFGSGSGLLLPRERIEQLRRFATQDGPAALFNNFYSCDFAAISEATTLLSIELPRTDNPLGFALADTGIPCSTLERNAETQFDIDTPTDLLILNASERGGPAIRSLLDRLDPDHPFLPHLLELLSDRSAHVHLVGRLSPKTWADIESEVACRTSGSIEGRGMRAGTNAHVPFLHQTLREDGERAFFRRLSLACDGAVIDARPLLARDGLLPEASVRFASDLLRPDAITDPTWRSFTEAALDAPIPVLLGGHSAVSGGLYLLAEACWKGRNLDRRLHPEPFNLDKERS